MESVPEQPEVTNKAEGDSLGSGSNGFYLRCLDPASPSDNEK